MVMSDTYPFSQPTNSGGFLYSQANFYYYSVV